MSNPLSNNKNNEYFEEQAYKESSPLTDAQKYLLSKSEVGEARLAGQGLLSFMNKNQQLKHNTFNQP